MNFCEINLTFVHLTSIHTRDYLIWISTQIPPSRGKS
jgi:hypothetical protein